MGGHEADGALDIVVIDQDEVVEAAAQHGLGEGEARPDGQACHAGATVDSGRLAGLPGAVRGRSSTGLDADDPALGRQDIAHEAGSGGPGARADRGVDGSQTAVAAEELEVDGGVPEHDRRLVAGGDHAHPLAQRERLGVGERVAHRLALDDDAGAQGAHRGHLAGRCAHRDDDGDGHVAAGARPGQGLGVVAGGGGHDSAAPFLGAERRHECHPAADLEGTGGLDVLVLDHDVDPGLGAEQRVGPGGSLGQDARDGLVGAQDGVEVEALPGTEGGERGQGVGYGHDSMMMAAGLSVQ